VICFITAISCPDRGESAYSLSMVGQVVLQKSPRQADAVLRAFRYQLAQSLATWLDLSQGEELWLEVSEDFTRQSADLQVDVQVKSSTAERLPRYSLRSADVQSALLRFWKDSAEGLDPRPRLIFLAHGTVAKEQGLPFPGDAPGLTYWRAAALDADTTTIRTALSTVLGGTALGGWLQTNPSDQALRDRLLRRVSWAFEAPTAQSLDEAVRDRVVALYLSKNLVVTAVDEAMRILRDIVFETACRPDPGDRRLTLADLHTIVEETIPISTLQAMVEAIAAAGQEIASRNIMVSEVMPAERQVTSRQLTVDRVLAERRGEPVIWIHGSPGVGKTTLARLIALRSGGRWLILDLRPTENARAALAAWRELVLAVQGGPPVTGVIVDDLSDSSFDALKARIAALAASLSGRGGRVLITSAREPSPARLSALGAGTLAALQSPYLTIEELTDLISALGEGPDPQMLVGWAYLISMATASGHPLLAVAKITSLRGRQWPSSALLEDFGSQSSEAVQSTRAEARRRLLEELGPSGSREVLRRVSGVYDRADEALVRKLAECPPIISNVSDSIALLRGSWLEVTPDGGLRISPLVADLARDVTPEELGTYRCLAAEHWLATGALNENTLPLCFWNAFTGRHGFVLMKLAETIQTLPRDMLRATAAVLSPITALATDRPLLSDVPAFVLASLRLLQFSVADALEENEVAVKAATRLLQETESIEYEDVQALSISVGAGRVLLSQNTNIPPALILQYTIRLRTVTPRLQAIGDERLAASPNKIVKELHPELDIAGFLFASIATRIRSSERFASMIEALDIIPNADRNELLDDIIRALGSLYIFVHGPWAAEQLAGNSGEPVLGDYDHAIQITTKWNRPDLAIELAVARAVILDELMNRGEAALVGLDAVIATTGNNPRLTRQKAKVLAHSGNSQEAAQLILSIENEIGIDAFDRGLALRDGAIWAQQAGRSDDSLRLFEKAREAFASDSQHAALAAGAMVEKSLVLWSLGERRRALVELGDSLEAVEQLDSRTSRQNERAHRAVCLAVGQFRLELEPFSGSKVRLAIGRASELVSEDQPFSSERLPSLADNWGVLTVVEAEVGEDAGIAARSLGKQAGPSLASTEMFLTVAKYSGAIKTEKFEVAFRMGALAASILRLSMELRSSGADPRIQAELLGSKSVEELVAAGWLEPMLSIPTDLLLWRWLSGDGLDEAFLDTLTRACESAWNRPQFVVPIFKAASGLYQVGADASLAVRLAEALSNKFDPTDSPAVRFRRDLLLLGHSSQSFARRLLEPSVVAIIIAGWKLVLQSQRFALKAPNKHSTEIELGIADAEVTGLPGVVRLLTAAAPAVGLSIDSWNAFLSTVAKTKPGPATSVDHNEI
jgi:tetratricopeptide (TPR) repeat protein